jgi:hypothetical protein
VRTEVGGTVGAPYGNQFDPMRDSNNNMSVTAGPGPVARLV